MPSRENDLFPEWMSARDATAAAGIALVSFRVALDRADRGEGYAPPRVDRRLNAVHADDFKTWREAVAASPLADRPVYPARENPFASYLTAHEVAELHDMTAKRIGDALDRYRKTMGRDVQGTTSFGGRRLLQHGAWERHIASQHVAPVAGYSKAEALAEIVAAHTEDGVLDVRAAVADKRSSDLTAADLAGACGRTRQTIHAIRTAIKDTAHGPDRMADLATATSLASTYEEARDEAKNLVSPRTARARRDAAEREAAFQVARDQASERLALKNAQAAERARFADQVRTAKATARTARLSAVAEMVARDFTTAQIAERLDVSLSCVTSDRRTLRLAARA